MNEITDKFNNNSKNKELTNSLKSKPFLSISSDFSVEELYNILSKNPYLINTEDEKNETFLSYAIKRNNIDIINLLLTSPIINLTYQNEKTGNTYLHLAVIHQNIKLIKELLKKNIFIDIQNNEGNTALHLAYYVNNINIIKLLIENNIDFAIKNRKGLTAEEIDPIENISDIPGYNINNELNINLNTNKKNANDVNLNLSNSGETKYKSSLKTKGDNYLKEKNYKNSENNFNNIKNNHKKYLSNGFCYLFEDKNDSININKEDINDLNINNFDIRLSNISDKNDDIDNIEIDNLKTIKNDFPLNPEFDLSTINAQKNSLDTNINTNKKKEKINKSSNKSLYEFLSQINMQKYYDNLNNNGFEYVNIIIEDTKLGNNLTDAQLKMININIPGDRAKILIRFEEKADLFDFNVPKNVYYFLNDISLNKIESDLNLIKLNNWLKNIKLEQYLKNFIDNGYYSTELLLFQTLSKNPLNDDILKNEFRIEKLGHRARILNKLKEESKKYLKNLRDSIVTFHAEENSKICSECCLV